MKSLLLASATLAGVALAAPAFAGVGTLEAGYGQVQWKAGPWSGDLAETRLGGAYAHTVHGDWNVQVEARETELSWDGDDGGLRTGSHLAAHVFKRTDGYSLGGFAGTLAHRDTTGQTWGVEGQKFFDRATLSASAGFGHFNSWGDYDVRNVQAGATYFVTDNLAVTGGVGYATWDAGATDRIWLANAGAEYKFGKSPASVFAQYRHDAVNYAGPVAADRDTVMLGLRLSFGADTLKARERTGPSLQGAAALSDAVVAW